jgi:hypothetical protein
MTKAKTETEVMACPYTPHSDRVYINIQNR